MLETETESTMPASSANAEETQKGNAQAMPASPEDKRKRGKAFEKAMEIKSSQKEEPNKAESAANDNIHKSEPAKTEPADPQEPKKDAQGKTENDRIRDLIKEKKTYKADLEKLQAELNALKSIKEEEKSAKDHAMEAQLEIKVSERMQEAENDLQAYAYALDDMESFVTNYDYYIPLIAKGDPWTIEKIDSYPEKWAMLDKLTRAMTEGVFSVQDWINAPMPLKLKKLNMLASQIRADQNQPAPKKEVPDSIVPETKTQGSKIEPPDQGKRGKAFEKAFGLGNKRLA
jgi:vacuolar-type H+-ATPase subunit I/STV1